MPEKWFFEVSIWSNLCSSGGFCQSNRQSWRNIALMYCFPNLWQLKAYLCVVTGVLWRPILSAHASVECWSFLGRSWQQLPRRANKSPYWKLSTWRKTSRTVPKLPSHRVWMDTNFWDIFSIENFSLLDPQCFYAHVPAKAPMDTHLRRMNGCSCSIFFDFWK